MSDRNIANQSKLPVSLRRLQLPAVAMGLSADRLGLSATAERNSRHRSRARCDDLWEEVLVLPGVKAAAMKRPRIDAHAHLACEPTCSEMLDFIEALDLRIINTSGSLSPGWHDQGRVATYRRIATERPDRFAWITGFDVPAPGDAGGQDRMVAQVEADFAAGAVGCKVWRHVGMSVRAADGSYLMMDDPLFDPLYASLIAHDRTLLVHISEPWQRWPSWRAGVIGLYARSPDRGPLEEEYGPIDFPGPEEQISALNRVLARHPRLRVVGAHLGGLEHDVRLLAAQLEAFPNFAIDTSARRRDLALQALRDREAVRAFFCRYAERILWGMDQGTGKTVLSGVSRPEVVADAIRSNGDGYAMEWAFLEEEGTVHVDGHDDIPGLALPEDVLRQIYVESALRWYPWAFMGTGLRGGKV